MPKKKPPSKIVGQDQKTVKADKKEPAKAEPAQSKQAKKKETKEKAATRAVTSSPSHPPAPRLPVVGIGASAGGLEAMTEFLKEMPDDPGMALVIVTHQHPGHSSMLPELLGKVCAMPVVEVEDGQPLQPNHVYVMPPGGQLAILGGVLHTMETERHTSPKLPIDYFFRSLAEDQAELAVCIVLSGTGTDGTLGLQAVKGVGGMAMVERPESAKYPGMPTSAIATGLADYVLPPAEMPQPLISYTKGPFLAGASTAAEAPSVPAEPMQKIFVLLRSRTGHDFSAYKSNTLRRRIERRMNVHQIKKPSDYVKYLEDNAHEVDLLFKELLIRVTSFFRDVEAWETLGGQISKLLKEQTEGSVVRAWVPGCATGEEVYSLAILVRTELEKLKRHSEVQIFGTDLDSSAVDIARTGQYPEGIAVDVSLAQLERYFVHSESAYRIRKEVREMVVFAQQNLIKDPPFTKLDMISCRNLLIYLNSDLQKLLLPIFHYALKPGGLLFLGPSESIGSSSDLFELLDKRWKIFRRKENVAAAHVLSALPVTRANQNRLEEKTVPDGRTPIAKSFPALIERLLLSRFAPASVVVSERGDIIYIHGRTGMYLEPSPGQPRANILEMAREGLQLELASAIRQCNAKGAQVVREGVRVKTNGDFSFINLTVAKLSEPESVRDLLLVTFQPLPPPMPLADGKTKRKKKPGDVDQIEELEQALKYTKESHQTTLEELETANEELKSTNEELQSTNEELQSSNEELETAKEEMQSLNEELSTVNSELQTKVEDLSQSNDDMQNLLNSTDIATLFLDEHLNINRFTEQTQHLIKVRNSDLGRPVSELATNLNYKNLLSDCQQVLKTLEHQECQVCDNNGVWYLMRIRPYRTSENMIDGLVITFVNIEPLKTAERAAELRTFFESIIETFQHPLLVLDDQLRVTLANHSFYQKFQLARKQVIGTILAEIENSVWENATWKNVTWKNATWDSTTWNNAKMNEVLSDILSFDSKFEAIMVTHESSAVGRRELLFSARRLEQSQSLPGMIILTIEDKTAKTLIEKQ